MKTHTIIRSRGAIALGGFFAGVTAYVLFADVAHGAAITTSHVMALAALVAAIASGHMAWPAIRSGAIIPGLMLAVLFLGSTGYVVISSGARNAEQAGNKAAAIEAANAVRSREETQLAKAEAMLAEANRKLASECASGNGTRCKGTRATVEVYEAAVKGHLATIASLPAPKIVNGYGHAAKVLQSWGLTVTAGWLELNMPFVVVIVAELGTIAFLHLGLGHVRRPEPIWKPADVAPMPEEEDHVIDWVRAFRAANGRDPKIPELQSKFPQMAKTTAWRRCKAA